MTQADLRGRVEAAAAAALARQKFVTPVDVCVGMGWLHKSNVEDWRRGHVDDLEYFLPVHDDRAKRASLLSAVVVRWSRARKRYERQGLLVEEAASGVPREAARDRVRPDIDGVLNDWAQKEARARTEGLLLACLALAGQADKRCDWSSG